VVTLAAYGVYWFSLAQRVLRSEAIDVCALSGADKPLFEVEQWADIAEGRLPEALTDYLPQFLQTRRWFLGKGRTILSTELIDLIPIPDTNATVGLLRIEYAEGDPDVYIVPGASCTGEEAERMLAERPDTVLARVRSADGQSGILYSAVADRAFAEALLGAIARRRRMKGRNGELVASHTRAFRRVYGSRPALDPVPLFGDQRNSSILFGDRFVLKLLRRVEPGLNPEAEIGEFLTGKVGAPAPPLTGSIEYRRDGESMSIAILTGYVPNHGDGWTHARDVLGRFFENAITRPEPEPPVALLPSPSAVPEVVHELLGEYPETARLLGLRLGELHASLASGTSADFAPEPFTDHYRQGLYHGMIGRVNQAFRVMEEFLDRVPIDAQAEARSVLDSRDQIRALFRPIRDHRFQTSRIRIHGDLNLRQVLNTGKDWVFIDFEGLPGRSYGERRIKRNPLRDVAALLRSFQYAAFAVRFGRVPGIILKPENAAAYEAWAAFWSSWASALFLSGYLSVRDAASLLPASGEEIKMLLDAFLMERALAEAATELRDRPDWTVIPLRGISMILPG